VSDGAVAAGEEDALARRTTRELFDRDRCSRGMGMEVLESREGYAKVAMTVRGDMMSGLLAAHGGVIFTLADSAFAFACNSRNEMNVALQCSISFHSGAAEGERLIAVCEERSRTSRTGVYDVEVTSEDGRLIALFRGVPYRLNRSTV
jgi:acyl-CoA thioesterase